MRLVETAHATGAFANVCRTDPGMAHRTPWVLAQFNFCTVRIIAEEVCLLFSISCRIIITEKESLLIDQEIPKFPHARHSAAELVMTFSRPRFSNSTSQRGAPLASPTGIGRVAPVRVNGPWWEPWICRLPAPCLTGFAKGFHQRCREVFYAS